MARLFASIIAVVAWTALGIQFRATLDQGHAIGETLWILLRFFTVMTNLLVAVVMTMTGLGRTPRAFILAGTTLAIVLVGMVYITLLRGMTELSGGALLADTLLHKVIPVAVAAWWLAFAAKGRLDWRMPAGWALYPFVYLMYALLRGRAEGKYAYPFIDAGQLGWPAVALNAVLIALAFLVAGFGLVALDRRMGATNEPDRRVAGRPGSR